MQTIELKTIVRQSGDTDFINLLTPVRVGRCSEATTAALAACHVDSKPLPRDGIMPTKLYCKNANVDAENSAHLAKLPGVPVRLPATDTFKVSLTLTLALALALALALTLTLTLTLGLALTLTVTLTLAPALALALTKGEYSADTRSRLLELVEKKAAAELELKVGAQCLLTKNLPELKLVNGSRGVVTGFEQRVCGGRHGVPEGAYVCPLVTFDSGQRLAVQPSSFFQVSK